jgi:hypothetical protein
MILLLLGWQLAVISSFVLSYHKGQFAISVPKKRNNTSRGKAPKLQEEAIISKMAGSYADHLYPSYPAVYVIPDGFP